MRRTYYGTLKPRELEISDDGLQMRLRLDIQEEIIQQDMGDASVQYSAIEIACHAPFSRDRAMEQFFGDYYGNDHENKLINEYNSAVMGLYDEPERQEKMDRYKAFLQERAALMSEVRRICEANDIH